MRRPVGIETEYGLNCEGFPAIPNRTQSGGSGGPPGVDFGYECARLVGACTESVVLRGWDYRGEDPYRDLRGMRVDHLDRDPHDLDGPDERSRALSRDELLANLAKQLPEIINQLTPNGRLPTEQEASRWI